MNQNDRLIINQVSCGYSGTWVKLERAAIVGALTHHRGNASAAARQLGLGRTTIIRKIRNYGIDVEATKRAKKPVDNSTRMAQCVQHEVGSTTSSSDYIGVPR